MSESKAPPIQNPMAEEDSGPKKMPHPLPNPIEAEVRLLRQAFQEQGKEIATIRSTVNRLEALLLERLPAPR